jgi:Flp pilus assembly protein TadD
VNFFIYYIIFFLLNPQFYTNIEQKNQYIDDFNRHMEQSNFKGAIQVFERLEEVHRVIDNYLRLDAAHAYFAVGDTAKARLNYEFSKDLSDPSQASISRNQLGILALMNGDSSAAIAMFKSAIEKDNSLQAARFNYELISSMYRPRRNAPPQEEDKQGDVEASEEKEQDMQPYVSENISRERALQLLDNLRNSERKGLITGKISKEKIEKDW